MKKMLVVISMIGILFLAACGAVNRTALPGNTAPLSAGVPGGDAAAALPLSSQLAIGTINLKDMANAVTPSQAAELLPLWQGLKALSASVSVSQVEMDALIQQIQSTMTTQQVQAIQEMKLTQADIAKSMQNLGVGNGFGGQSPDGTPIARTPGARGGGNGAAGGRPAGGGGEFPGGGFGGIPGGAAGGELQPRVNATPATQATLKARQSQRANLSNSFLDTAVIAYLEQLIAR